MDPATRYAKSGDVHIAYQVVGDGPSDVVFIPGWASHLELAWSDPGMAYVLNRFASFSRLIRFDKRGTGLSDPVVGAPTLEERMDDLRAVMDAAGSERAVLFGECEGGAMSVLFAATHPDRTEGLVVYGTMPSVALDDPSARRRVDVFFSRLSGLVDGWGRGMSLDLFAPSAAGDERLRRSYGDFERASASPGMACALLEALRDIDVGAAAANVRVPTLILHRRDDFVPIEPARRLAELIPGARLLELEGMDHELPLGDSEAVIGEAEEFAGTRRAPEPDRALLTVLFTDIVGSTGRAAELGDGRWRGLLTEHNRIVRRELERHRGHEVKTVGDGFVATFDGPARAIRCATASIAGVRRIGLEVRAGIHTGETELFDETSEG